MSFVLLVCITLAVSYGELAPTIPGHRASLTSELHSLPSSSTPMGKEQLGKVVIDCPGWDSNLNQGLVAWGAIYYTDAL